MLLCVLYFEVATRLGLSCELVAMNDNEHILRWKGPQG